MDAEPPPGLLRKLGLDRPAARAWAMYDWANSSYYTVIVAAVFPAFFVGISKGEFDDGEATRALGLVQALSMVISALMAPALGAIADTAGARKKLLAAFMVLGVLATGAMVFIGDGDWRLAATLLLLGNVGIVGSVVCYDGLLAHVAREGEMDQLSTSGYALGYLGGGLLLLASLGWILWPATFGLPEEGTLPVRLTFLAVAVWWFVFSIPLLLHVEEPPRAPEADEPAGSNSVANAFRRLRETLGELRGYRAAFTMLLAALFYGEGIGTIIKMAGAYATDLALDQNAIYVAFVLTQFVGIPFALAFGRLADRIGPRRAIYLSLVVYVFVCVYGFYLETERDFFVLAVTVGMIQGGAQALSRSLFASLIPAHKSTEFFGFFAFASKLAGSVGPVVFAFIGSATGSNRWAILGIASFFVVGGFLLSRVDVAAGQRAARAAEPRGI